MLALAVAAAAGLGAICRYAAAQLTRGVRRFPWNTWAVNVVGSFLLGVVIGLAARGALPAVAAVIAGAGFCGGFTTFSTWVWETLQLTHTGARRLAAAYVICSVIAGLLAGGAGLWLGRA